MDSLQGKLDAFSASFQQLSTTMIESSFLKAIVDTGTSALGVLNDMISALNTISSLGGNISSIWGTLGSIAGLTTSVLGAGFFKYNKTTKSIDNPFTSLFKSSSMMSSAQQGFFNSISGISQDGRTFNDIFATLKSNGAIEDYIQQMGIADQQLQNFLRTWDGTGNAMSAFQAQLPATTGLVRTLGTAFNGLKSIAASLGATLLNMAAMWAIGEVIGLVSEKIYDYVHAQEILIEKGKEASQAIQETKSAYEETVSIVEPLISEYAKLSQGVIVTDKGTTNASLSTEEYERFLEISNQLANVFPQLVTGYDDQGNAMLNLSGNADEVTASLENLLEQEQKIAAFKIGENLQASVAGSLEQLKILNDEYEDAQSRLEESSSVLGFSSDTFKKDINSLEDIGFEKNNNGTYTFKIGYETGSDEEIAIFNAQTEALIAAGESLENQNLGFFDTHNAGGEDWVMDLANLGEEGANAFIDAYRTAMGNSDEGTVSEMLEIQANAQAAINSISSEMKATWNTTSEELFSSLQAYDIFNGMSEEMQNGIQQAIKETDPNEFIKGYAASDANSYREYLRQMYIDPMTDLAPEIQEATNDLFDIDMSSMNLVDYNKELQSALDKIKESFGDDTEGYEEFINYLIKIGFTVEQPKDHELKAELAKAGYGGDEFWEKYSTLNADQQLQIHTSFAEDPDFDVVGFIDKCVADAQTQADKAAREAAGKLTLSELLFDEEGNQTEVNEGIQKSIDNLGTIQDAISSLKSGEAVDANDLVQDFPELADQIGDLDTALSDLETQNIADVVSSIFSGIDTEDQDILKSAQDYLDNLFANIDMENVDVSELKRQVLNSFLEGSTNDLQDQAITDWVNSWFDNLTFSIPSLTKIKNEVASTISASESAVSALNGYSSATGLTTDEIDGLIDAYKDLDSYDPAALFDKTSQGIQVNAEELKKLQAELDANTMADVAERIIEKQKELNQARTEGADTSAIEAELLTLSQLQAQLEATSGAYNNYVNAKSTTNKNSAMEEIGSDYDSMKKVLDAGWWGNDDLNAYVDLLVAAEKQTGNIEEDFAQITKTIEGTSHSLKDYFTFDDDGNFTEEGIDRFLHDTESLLPDIAQYTEGEGWTFDATGENLQTLADRFGTTTDMISIFLSAMEEAGMNVEWEDPDIFENYDQAVQSATKSIQELKEEGKISKGFDTDFDAATMSASELKGKLDEIGEEKTRVEVEGGEGSEETIRQLERLEESTQRDYIVHLDTETGGGVQSVLSEIQTLDELTQNGATVTVNGEVDPSIEEAAQTIADLMNENPEIKASFGIETDGTVTAEDVLSAYQNQTLELPVKVSKFETDLSTNEIEAVAKVNRIELDSGLEAEIEVTGKLTQVSTEGVETPEVSVNNTVEDSSSTVNVTANTSLAIAQINAVKGLAEYNSATINVDANTEEAKGKTDEAVSYANEQTGTITINGNNAPALAQIRAAVGYANSSTGTITVDAETSQITSAIDNALNKNFTINVSANVSGLPGQLYTGTATLATGSAKVRSYADGSLYTSYRHSMGAYANGSWHDWGLPDDQVALVNEERLNGHSESIVHQGRWSLLPGGAHFQKLQRGDIIFSAKQTDQLIKYGKINGHGKTIGMNAHAEGTGIPAFSDSGGKATGNTKNWGNSSSTPPVVQSIQQAAKTVAQATISSGNTTAKATESASDSVSEALQKVIDALGNYKDWVEVKLDRDQRSIDINAAKATNAVGYGKKNEYVTKEQKSTTKLIKDQKKAESEYMDFADKVKRQVGLSDKLYKKVLKGTINIQKLSADDKARVDAVTEWVDKAKDAKLAAIELQDQLGELAQEKFDNIKDQFEAITDQLEHTSNMIDKMIDKSETMGRLSSELYYNTLIANEKNIRRKNEKQLEKLKASLQASLADGSIKKNDTRYNDMINDINDLTEEIYESGVTIEEWKEKITSIKWDLFDRVQDKISNITTEAEFLISLMEDSELFDDNGRITAAGLATQGLHVQSYQTYMEQAQDYADEIKSLNSQIANDKANTKLVDRRDELINKQQEVIKSAHQEKKSLQDLAKQGVEKMVSSLNDLIEKYQETITAQKDLNDYSSSVQDKQKEIAKLEKQLAVREGDTSESGKAQTAKLREQLESKRKELQDTQLSKEMDNISNLLSDISSDYENALNEKVEDLDEVLRMGIDQSVANTESILNKLTSVATSVNTSLSESIKTIWSGGTVNTSKGVSQVESGVQNQQNLADQQAMSDFGIDTNNTQTTIASGSDAKAAQEAEQVQRLREQAKIQQQAVKVAVKSGTKHKAKLTAKEKKEHNALWEYIVEKYKYAPNNSVYSQIANILGVKLKNSSKPSKTEKKKILTALKTMNAYKTGARRIDEDQSAWIGENSSEYIVRKSDGAILQKLNRGDSVLNADQVDNIYKMSKNPTEYMKDALGSTATNITNQGANVNVTMNNTFELENVTDPQSFMNYFKNNKAFEILIQDMTLGKISGSNNRLSKFRN